MRRPRPYPSNVAQRAPRPCTPGVAVWASAYALAGLWALGVAPGCVPIEGDADAADGETAADVGGVDAGGRGAEDTNDPTSWPWPPDLPTGDDASGSGAFGPAGDDVAFFDGELVVTFDAGALAETHPVTVVRALVPLGDRDVVGYIWGEHGLPSPIDPPGDVTVRIPTRWVEGGLDAASRARLSTVAPDGATVAPLPNGATRLEGLTLVLEGELPRLGTLVVEVPED